jgi:hypothetical protein
MENYVANKNVNWLDTDFENSPKLRRGPPTEFSNAQLHNRRDQLVQAFEGAWPLIGWPLETCKRPDDLTEIFLPFIQRFQYSQEIIGVFCRPSSAAADWRTLRKLRTQLRAKSKSINKEEGAKSRVEKQFTEANAAFAQASEAERHAVKRVLNKKGKEKIQAGKRVQKLLAEERELKQSLESIGPNFARQELFRFFKSERYELTPVNLANAAANLPYSGWRQSMRRCRLSQPSFSNGPAYQIFKAIRYITGASNKRHQNILINDFRNGIRSLPSRHKDARNQLARHWFFVERAIERIFKKSKHPRALAFEIAQSYLEQIRSISKVEQVLAAQDEIVLSTKRTKVSPVLS